MRGISKARPFPASAFKVHHPVVTGTAPEDLALFRNHESLEAPPGFEPGMEVLQTSALPLGDGAGWNLCTREDPAASRERLQQRDAIRTAGAVMSIMRQSEQSAFASATLRRDILRASIHGSGRMERETGFEPATSTLARSHSTTELFPLATNL